MTALTILLVVVYLVIAAMNAVDIKRAQNRRQRLYSAALFSYALILAAWMAATLKI